MTLVLLSIEKILFSLSSSSYNLKLSTKSFLKNDFNLRERTGEEYFSVATFPKRAICQQLQGALTNGFAQFFGWMDLLNLGWRKLRPFDLIDAKMLFRVGNQARLWRKQRGITVRVKEERGEKKKNRGSRCTLRLKDKNCSVEQLYLSRLLYMFSPPYHELSLLCCDINDSPKVTISFHGS